MSRSVTAIAQSACPADALEPRRLIVARDAMVIEGHEIFDVELTGYAIGPELGTAPIVLVVFPFQLQQEMHLELEAAGATASLWTLESEFGHDAFLADQARLAGVLRDAGCFAAGRRPR